MPESRAKSIYTEAEVGRLVRVEYIESERELFNNRYGSRERLMVVFIGEWLVGEKHKHLKNDGKQIKK